MGEIRLANGRIVNIDDPRSPFANQSLTAATGNEVEFGELPRNAPVRTALASLASGFATGIPALAGLAGALGVTARDTIGNGIDDNFGQELLRNMQPGQGGARGIPGDLLGFAFDTDLAIREALGLPPIPLSTGDQIANVIPFIPNPTRGLPRGVNTALNLLTPAVRFSPTQTAARSAREIVGTQPRVNFLDIARDPRRFINTSIDVAPGFANRQNLMRTTAQIGIMGGFDQGLRGAIGLPLAFSDEAIEAGEGEGETRPRNELELLIAGMQSQETLDTGSSLISGAQAEELTPGQLLQSQHMEPSDEQLIPFEEELVPLSGNPFSETLDAPQGNIDFVVPETDTSDGLSEALVPIDGAQPNVFGDGSNGRDITESIIINETRPDPSVHPDAIPALRQADRDMGIEAGGRHNISSGFLIGAGLLGGVAGYIALRGVQRSRFVSTPFRDAPHPLHESGLRAAGGRFLDGMRDAFTNSAVRINRNLQDTIDPETGQPALSNEAINSIQNTVEANVSVQAEAAIGTGRMPGGTGVQGVPLREIRAVFDALSDEEATLANNALNAAHAEMSSIRATVAQTPAVADEVQSILAGGGNAVNVRVFLEGLDIPLVRTGLMDGSLPDTVVGTSASSNAAVAAITAARQNPRVAAYMDVVGRYTDAFLEQRVKIGQISQDTADIWRRETMVHSDITSPLFVPGSQGTVMARWHSHLSNLFGPDTSLGREHANLARVSQQSVEEGLGVRFPSDPIEALVRYGSESIEETHRTGLQAQYLGALTGFDVTTGQLTARANRSGVHYMGTTPITISADIPTIIRSGPHASNAAVRSHFQVNNTVRSPEADLAARNQIMTLRWRDQDHHFFVPNSIERTILDQRPIDLGMIDGAVRVLSVPKNLLQATTTGLFTGFSPISAGFATQAGAVNRLFLREGGFSGAISGLGEFVKSGLGTVRTVQGVIQINAHRRLENAARQITTAIANVPEEFDPNAAFITHPLSRMSPRLTVEQAQSVATNINDRLASTVVSTVRREAGGVITGLGNTSGDVDIRTIMRHLIPGYGESVGTTRRLYRALVRLNDTLHEAPAIGAIAREIGKGENFDSIEGSIRMARIVREAKDQFADNRRVGSDVTAQIVHRVVPYAAPTIQSLAAFHTAIVQGIRRNPAAVVAGLSTVMLTSMQESMMASMLGPEYSDYYWNTLDSRERTNFWRIFIPGLPPERAFKIRVVPELAPFKALGIEAMDFMTGASRGEHIPSDSPSSISGNNGAHMTAGLARYLDIPIDPNTQALFAAAGLRLETGFNSRPGEARGPIAFQPLATDERISGDLMDSTRVHPLMDTRVSGIIQAYTGRIGDLSIAILEGINRGVDRGGIVGGIEQGLDEAVFQAHKMVEGVPGVDTLFQGAIDERNIFNEDAALNRRDIEGIERIAEAVNEVRSLGLAASGNDRPGSSDAIIPSDDPIVDVLHTSIDAINQQVSRHREFIRGLRQDVDFYRSGTVFTQDIQGTDIKAGDTITAQRRREATNVAHTVIQQQNAAFRLVLQDYEANINAQMLEVFGRDVDFSFGSFNPRENVTPGNNRVVN